jgi:hypothetical protein
MTIDQGGGKMEPIWVVVGASGKDLYTEAHSLEQAQAWAERELAGGCYHIERRVWVVNLGRYVAVPLAY